MGISDVIFDTTTQMVREVSAYYDNPREVSQNKDIIKIVATNLKILARLDHFRPSDADLARIEAVNWPHMAKEFIIQVLEN